MLYQTSCLQTSQTHQRQNGGKVLEGKILNTFRNQARTLKHTTIHTIHIYKEKIKRFGHLSISQHDNNREAESLGRYKYIYINKSLRLK